MTVKDAISWLIFFSFFGMSIFIGSEFRSWASEYKTIGNVPCDKFTDMVCYIFIAIILFRISNSDSVRDRQKSIIKETLCEHDKEKP